MPARTGAEFLRGLKEKREVWVEGERVGDPVTHPAFAGAAHALAEVFDLQHQAAEICLMPDPETGAPINVSHMIPRSKADLEQRHKGLERIAEYSVGLMGRTPDYMNVTYAGLAGRADEWAAHGNEQGAENLHVGVASGQQTERFFLGLDGRLFDATLHGESSRCWKASCGVRW